MSAGAPSLSLVAKSSSDDPAPCFRKGSKFSYTLDFLLSIRKSDRCQRLPCNLDSTILCELNEAPQQIRPPLPIISHSSKWDCNYVRSSLQSSYESGILGKGALLRAPFLKSFAMVPKTQETTSSHLLVRSTAPYRPPHLYKPNLHPEIDDGGVKAFGTSEVNRAVKTEEERQKEASESLWREQRAIQDIEMNASSVQKENLDSSNTTCTLDFKKYNTPVEESGDSEPIKNFDLIVDQNTKLSSSGILSGFKEGTEGKPTDHNTEMIKQQLKNTSDGSNDGIRELKASTYPSAAEEVFKQLHEWDKATKEREENSGHNLLHLLEESTCVESLVAAFCICDEEEEEEEEEDSTEDTVTSLACEPTSKLCFPEECHQSTFDLPAEVHEPPLDINLRGALSTTTTTSNGGMKTCEPCSEMRLDISTGEGLSPPVILAANASDEICWPDEDTLITVSDFICSQAANGIYTEVGCQDAARPIDVGESDETSSPAVSNPEDVTNMEKKTPPTTPASKTTKSNRIVKMKKHIPLTVFPPYPSMYPRFDNAITAPPPLPLPPTPPTLYGPPPFCPFPLNQMAPYSQFRLPPPFGFPHQMYGNLSAKPDLSGDLGMLNKNKGPFEELRQLDGGHLGWPWCGNNS